MTARIVLIRTAALAGLAGWATVAIVRATLMVARDVISPTDRVAPGVVIVPLRSRTPLEITVLSGLIILTPGTLTVSVRPDLAELWVHGMYAADPHALRAELVDLESRVLAALHAGEERR